MPAPGPGHQPYYMPPPQQNSYYPRGYGHAQHPPPAHYPQYPQGLPPIAKPPNNGKAITSMVFGIISSSIALLNLFIAFVSFATILLLVCSPPICTITGIIGTVLGIMAVVYGFKAKNIIAKSPGTEGGSGFALAGIIMGFTAGGVNLLTLIFAGLGTVFLVYIWMTW